MIIARFRPLIARRYVSCRAVLYSEHGNPQEVLKVHTYELPRPTHEQFLVRFLASPINPADLNQIEGVYPKRPKFSDSFNLGRHAAIGGNEGLVEVIKPPKSQLSMKWKLGQWAIMKHTTFGTWRTHAIAEENDLLMVPDGLNPIDVATVSVNPCTAYRMLRDFTPLKPDDWVLQNGANSAVGRSVIQIAKIWGLRTCNVIRERDGWEEVRDELLRLGATQVITDAQLADREYMKTEFSERPKLALNCIGGANAMNMCRYLDHGAHIVTYGAMARQPLKVAASHLIFKDFHFHGFWVSPWNDKHPDERVEMLNEIFGWMEGGQFKSPPVDVNTWTLDQTETEAQDVFLRALKDTSKKQVLVMHY